MIRNLLESLDNNHINSYYTQFNTMLDMVLGDTDNGQDASVPSSYAFISKIGAIKAIFDAIGENLDYDKLYHTVTSKPNDVDTLSYKRKYLYLAARAIPTVAYFIKNYAVSLNADKKTIDVIDKYIVNLAETDYRTMNTMADMISYCVISATENGIKTRSNARVDEDSAASELNNDMLGKVVETDILNPSKHFVDSLMSYIERSGFRKADSASSDEIRNAIWIISGYAFNRYIVENDATIRKNSQSSMLDASRLIFGAVLSKYRDESHAANKNQIQDGDAILVRDADNSSTTAPGTINHINDMTMFTSNYTVPVLCKNYGAVNAAATKSKEASGRLAAFRLALVTYYMDLMGVLDRKNFGQRDFYGMGDAIDKKVEEIAGNVHDAISFRAAMLDVIDSADVDAIADTYGIDEQKVGESILGIIKNFLYGNGNGVVTGNVDGAQEVVVEHASKLPCIGSDDKSDRTTASNRTGLTTNGVNIAKLFAVEGDDSLRIFQSIRHSNTEMSDVISMDDVSSTYTPTFLVDVAATEGSSYRSWSMLIGIVPYTGVRNGTALDTIGLSDVNEKMSDRVYYGMQEQEDEDPYQQIKERLNTKEFRNELIRGGFANHSFDDSNYFDAATNAMQQCADINLSSIASIAKKFTKAVNFVKHDLTAMKLNLHSNGSIANAIDSSVPTIGMMLSGKDVFIQLGVDKMVNKIANILYGNILASAKVDDESSAIISDDGKRTLKGSLGQQTLAQVYNSSQQSIDDINGMITSAKSVIGAISNLHRIGNDESQARKIIYPAVADAYRFISKYGRFIGKPGAGLDELKPLYDMVSTKTSNSSKKDKTETITVDDLNKMANTVNKVCSICMNVVDVDGNVNPQVTSKLEQFKARNKQVLNDAMGKDTRGDFVKNVMQTVLDDADKMKDMLVDVQSDIQAEHITKAEVHGVLTAMNKCCAYADNGDRYSFSNTFSEIYHPLSVLITLKRTVDADAESMEFESNVTEFDDIEGSPAEIDELRPESNVEGMRIAQLKQEIESEGHIELTDQELAAASQREDDVDDVIAICDRINKTKEAVSDINEQLEAFKEELSEAQENGRNPGQLQDVVSNYEQMALISEGQIKDAYDHLNKYLNENPEMRGFAMAMMSGEVTANDVKIANSVIYNSAEVLAELTKDPEGRLAYTSSDQTTLAQIMYVLGAYILYPESDLDDTIGALESLREIIGNDSGNPVSLAAIDKVCTAMNNSRNEATAVKLLIQLGNVYMGDENEIVGNYVSSKNGLTRHGDFDTMTDNSIDAFARTQLRSSSLNKDKNIGSDSDESKARGAYITGIKDAMMLDTDLAEFAYAVGMISGTFDRSLTDERYSDKERIGRRANSYTKNIADKNLLFGNLAKNPIQMEVLNAIIDDERAGECGEGGKYPRLRKVVESLMGGSDFDVYSKNYSSSSVANPYNSRKTASKNYGQRTFAQIVLDVDPSAKDRHDLPTGTDITDQELVDLVKVARHSLYSDMARAIVNGGSETDKYKKIALEKLREFIADLNTPISEIITATTSIGQKIGGDIMIEHNKNRLINYASSRKDDTLMDDLPRMMLQQNHVVPQRLSDKLSEVDEYWIDSIAKVVAKIPEDIDVAAACNFVDLYYGSENDANAMLGSGRGEMMYRVLHSLESLDTESGLPHGFFGDDKAARRVNMKRLMKFVMSIPGDTPEARAEGLREVFLKNRESGSTDLNIGVRPSEATRRKIAHMRVAPSMAKAIDSDTFMTLVEILENCGYVSYYRNHIVKLSSGITLDDNTFKQVIERTMTSMIMYNLNASANGQQIEPNALISMNEDDVSEWLMNCDMESLRRLVAGIDYTIIQSRSGYEGDKIAEFGNKMADSTVSEDDTRAMFELLTEKGIVAYNGGSMANVAHIGYTPIMLIVDAIKNAVSTVENPADNFEQFYAEFHNALRSMKNTDAPVYDLNDVSHGGKFINDDTVSDTGDDVDVFDESPVVETPKVETPAAAKKTRKKAEKPAQTPAATQPGEPAPVVQAAAPVVDKPKKSKPKVERENPFAQFGE